MARSDMPDAKQTGPAAQVRRDSAERRAQNNKEGAVEVFHCAHNEHDRPTVGLSIPYAFA